jgi:hypothetical protein
MGACIARFSSGLQSLFGHLILSACPTYPLSASTLSPGLRQWASSFIFFDVVPLTGGVGSADPHLIPCEDVDPELVPECGLPRIFMGCKGIPPCRGTLLCDLKVHPVDRHEAVVADVLGKMALKNNLLDGGGGQRGG